MRLTFDTNSHASQGARRYQEDACVFARLRMTSPPPADPMAPTVPMVTIDSGIVAVLADGMGGHVGGERASTLACRGFLDALSSRAQPAVEQLQAALDAANAAIRSEVLAEPHLNGMGCTLIGAVVRQDGLRWVSVGDSRLFLFRSGELFLLNEDHSLAPVLDQLAEQGELTRDQALNHPRRHHLRSALTGDEIELIDRPGESVALQSGDCVVLASDGIDTLEADAIADVIDRHRAGGAEAVAKALIGAVDGVERPGQDNTTVMAILVRARPA